MVLVTAAGWAVKHFAGYDDALPLGLLLGLVVAAMVPARGACPLDRGRGT